MITVESLTKSFSGIAGTVRALDGVSFEVGDATICGVVGEGGAGKSTLARCIAARERPDSGVVRLDGVDLTSVARTSVGSGPAVTGGFGLLAPGAADGLSRQRTVAGNVAFPLERRGIPAAKRRARVIDLLDLAGLTEHADVGVGSLDAPSRHRVALASILASGPAVLLADEPTGGAGAGAASGMLTVLDRARSELGLSVLVFTRDIGVVRKACDDVAVLSDGTLTEHGALLPLATSPGSDTAELALPGLGEGPAGGTAGYGRVAEVVLVGFAAVGALLPEAASRFDVDLAVLGGGQARFGDTPIARFALGVTGEQADAALAWIAEQGGIVADVPAAWQSRGTTRPAVRTERPMRPCRAA